MKGDESIVITNESLTLSKKFSESNIMHYGEKPLMEKLAEIVTKNGGDILEIGFGLHLSADGVQSNPKVTSHTIIEVHPKIYDEAIKWSKDKPNTKVILGDWTEVIPSLEKKYDGILHDTHIDDNVLNFLSYVEKLCKEDTIVGFFWYPSIDSRFDAIRFQIEEEYYKTIPYKENDYFKSNQFELKYTTYRNGKFSKMDKTKHII